MPHRSGRANRRGAGSPDMASTSQNATADVARVIAGDIAGGLATLDLVLSAVARVLPGAELEALGFLARRLGELTDELRMELAQMDAPDTARRRKRAVA